MPIRKGAGFILIFWYNNKQYKQKNMLSKFIKGKVYVFIDEVQNIEDWENGL